MRRWARAGCPAARAGRSYRFDLAAVRGWRAGQGHVEQPDGRRIVAELGRVSPRVALRGAQAAVAWTLTRSVRGRERARAEELLTPVAAWLDEPTSAAVQRIRQEIARVDLEQDATATPSHEWDGDLTNPPQVYVAPLSDEVEAARSVAVAAVGESPTSLALAVLACVRVLREAARRVTVAQAHEALGWAIREAVAPPLDGRALAPPEWLPQPPARFRVEEREGLAHGGPFELEQDTWWDVVDARTGEAVLSFHGEHSASYSGEPAGGGWSSASWSGVSDVRLAPDGRAVLVRERGETRRVPIPGA